METLHRSNGIASAVPLKHRMPFKNSMGRGENRGNISLLARDLLNETRIWVGLCVGLRSAVCVRGRVTLVFDRAALPPALDWCQRRRSPWHATESPAHATGSPAHSPPGMSLTSVRVSA